MAEASHVAEHDSPRSAAFQPDGLPGFGYVEHLASLRRELAEQPGKRLPLPYSGDVEHVSPYLSSALQPRRSGRGALRNQQQPVLLEDAQAI
jgi:hypothetical protein